MLNRFLFFTISRYRLALLPILFCGALLLFGVFLTPSFATDNDDVSDCTLYPPGAVPEYIFEGTEDYTVNSVTNSEGATEYVVCPAGSSGLSEFQFSPEVWQFIRKTIYTLTIHGACIAIWMFFK